MIYTCLKYFLRSLSREVLMRSISAFVKKDIRSFEHRLGNFFIATKLLSFIYKRLLIVEDHGEEGAMASDHVHVNVICLA